MDLPMRADKEAAKKAGVPTWLRRYSRQYGKGLWALLQGHKKYDAQGVPMLDHGRDRALKKLGVLALPERAIDLGVALAS